jgi:signal transduction histidine kinase
VDLDALVDGAVADITDAVGELRAISHGVRPSRLGNGLSDALRELGRACPIPVAVHVDDGDLPEDVRVAAYFVATEGVTNALKHAAANRVDIAVTRTAGGIRVAVGDDGRGGARPTPGSGLSRLRERLHEVDGGLAITSEAGRGTTLVAEIPCAS